MLDTQLYYIRLIHLMAQNMGHRHFEVVYKYEYEFVYHSVHMQLRYMHCSHSMQTSTHQSDTLLYYN